MHAITITIIICTYNRSTSLIRAIKSVINSSNYVSADYEIIVIDNNSADDTANIVTDYSRLVKAKVSYHRELRQGKTFALNTGIRMSRGQWLAFLDDDVVVQGDWFAKVHEALVQYSTCNVFGGKILPLLHEGISIPPWVRRQEPHYNAEGPLGDHDKGDLVRSYYERDMGTPCGANFFVRREVFEKYGLYNEKLNRAVKNLPMAEDSEFCYRLKKCNVPMFYIPDAVVYHDTPAEKLTKSYFRSYIIRMSRAYVHAARQESGAKRILNVPRGFFKSSAELLLAYAASVCGRETEDLRFSKQLELLRMMAICYWYFADRKFLYND